MCEMQWWSTCRIMEDGRRSGGNAKSTGSIECKQTTLKIRHYVELAKIRRRRGYHEGPIGTSASWLNMAVMKARL